jgi:hypothetical protein
LSITFYPFLFIQASLSAALYNILSFENKDNIIRRTSA